MNDNEQNFSNTPYKATGNLNTVIGNPNMNINSAVTSNIMENNNGVNINNNLNQNNIVNPSDNKISDFQNFNKEDKVVDDKNSLDNASLVNPVDEFLKKTSQTTNEINQTQTLENKTIDTSKSVVTNFSNLETVEKENKIMSSNTEVRYENVYDNSKKKQPKKTVKIPKEFKTAIFVVILLLVVISCFDVIYDFFRNFWIN